MSDGPAGAGKSRALVGLAALALLGGVGLLFRAREAPVDKPAGEREAVPLESPALPSATAPPVPLGVLEAGPRAEPVSANLDASPTPLVRARWGGGEGELGRHRMQEGNAEAPMSLALAGSDVLVLDQVNARVVRYDAQGRASGSFAATATTQELTVADDGTTVLLDRLVDKKVTLVGPSGRRVGEVPLPASAGEAGLLTGLFVDGNDVYVEREHGALVRVGTTDGQPSAEPKSLQGRPSKDGVLLLSATLSDAPAGLAVVNAFDRKLGALRFARQVGFARPAHVVAMLDTDAKGTIYLGLWAGEGAQVHVACMDPADGRVRGRVVVPLSETPEESFRDFAVRADGTIVFSHRTEQGVELRTATCP